MISSGSDEAPWELELMKLSVVMIELPFSEVALTKTHAFVSPERRGIGDKNLIPETRIRAARIRDHFFEGGNNDSGPSPAKTMRKVKKLEFGGFLDSQIYTGV